MFAAAAGTVVRARGDVADNPPGERNAHDPWGNVVVIQHGPALFSVVAHLSPGTLEVVIAALIAIQKSLPWRRAVTWGIGGLLLVLAIAVVAVPHDVPGLVVPGGSHSAMSSMGSMH